MVSMDGYIVPVLGKPWMYCKRTSSFLLIKWKVVSLSQAINLQNSLSRGRVA